MAKKRKALSVPKGMREWVPRTFTELGCPPEYADDFFKAFNDGDLDRVVARVWALGYMMGMNKVQKMVRGYFVEQNLPIPNDIKAGQFVGYAYFNKVLLHRKGTTAMHAARGQADIPEATKAAAVAMFKKLCAKYKKADVGKPATKAKAKVAKKFGVNVRTVSRWMRKRQNS
jgi:hypothetical protein